jgi:hypothetical protein
LPTNVAAVFGSGLVPFIDHPAIGATGAVVNISDNGGGAPDVVWLGKLLDASLTNGDIGVATVSIAAAGATTISDTGAGPLLLGAADVTNITAASTSHTVMDLPDTGGGVSGTLFNAENITLFHGVTVLGGGGADLLQGSSGPIAAATASATAFIGGFAADNLIGGHAGGDNMFGEGGNDMITLGADHVANDTVWFGFYDLGDDFGTPNVTVDQAITDIVDGSKKSPGIEISVNGYLGAIASITTVSNFQIGATGDVINFAPNDWVGSGVPVAITGGLDFGLREASNGNVIALGASTMQLITTPGGTPLADVTLDGISTYANAAALQAQLTNPGVGDIMFFSKSIGPAAGDRFHVLVAYSTGTQINIADVSLFNGTGATQVADTANPNITVSVSDLIDITGVSSLLSLNAHNIFFHA